MTTLFQTPINISDHPRQEGVNGRLGSLRTRLAMNQSEIRRAQQVRYKVFCEELNAKPNMRNRISRRDEDRFDQSCDHLLLFVGEGGEEGTIAGTQRFHVGNKNTKLEDYYSSAEFDISQLVERHPEKRFMELGRSCILPEYRNRRSMELMWHGTWQYALQHQADVMFGCASFQTTDPIEIADELGFLANANVGKDWQAGSVRSDRIDLRRFKDREIDPKSTIRKLPPLIRGYLRLGAGFSSVAVPDHEFGTIDVLVVLPLKLINPRYIAHYGSDAARHNR